MDLDFQEEIRLDRQSRGGNAEASRLAPDYAAAQRNRAGVWMKTADFDKAIGELNGAISINPRNATAFEDRGAAFAEKGDLENALADFDKAIRFDPANAEA